MWSILPWCSTSCNLLFWPQSFQYLRWNELPWVLTRSTSCCHHIWFGVICSCWCVDLVAWWLSHLSSVQVHREHWDGVVSWFKGYCLQYWSVIVNGTSFQSIALKQFTNITSPLISSTLKIITQFERFVFCDFSQIELKNNFARNGRKSWFCMTMTFLDTVISDNWAQIILNWFKLVSLIRNFCLLYSNFWLIQLKLILPLKMQLHPEGTSMISDYNDGSNNFWFNTSLWANFFAVICLETIHKYLIYLSINSEHYYMVLKVGMVKCLAK